MSQTSIKKAGLEVKLGALRQALLQEMKLPDFRGRHLFIAKLRLIIFILCWMMFIVFFPKIWVLSPYVPLIFNVGFFITSLCYLNIIREKYVIFMGILEVLADVISQTSILYLLGPDTAVAFVFYGLYVIGAGSFFGYLVSLLSATAALVSYCGLLFLMNTGIVAPFNYPTVASYLFRIEGFGYIFNLIFLPIALGVVVYASKIAYYFSKIKERSLETRNVQLLALNRIGSTIRRALNLQSVIDQVLKGVIQGLGFDVCFFALLSKEEKVIHFYVPQANALTERIEEIWGRKLSDLHLPLKSTNNSAYQSILKNRVIIRNEMVELTIGLVPPIDQERTKKVQKEIGFKKFVVTPLVPERKVVGALIGASRKAYVEESVIDTLDNFANQAALALESAQLFEELQQKNKQLEEANKIKSDFLAIMSHELRTPLTAIIGYSEILLDNVLGELRIEQKDSLSEVLKNAENLLQLINSILDLAKVEAGKMELNLESFPIGEVITEVYQTVTPLVGRKKQELSIVIPEGLPSLEADPRKLRQILLNLVGNAIKFTPDRGKIEVKVDYSKDSTFWLEEFSYKPEAYENRGLFKITVADNGIGIKEEHLSSIFDIFQQVDSTFTRRYQGTGLGLALTKQLVELHQGVIAVESKVGQGSLFKFLLPSRPTS